MVFFATVVSTLIPGIPWAGQQAIFVVHGFKVFCFKIRHSPDFKELTVPSGVKVNKITWKHAEKLGNNFLMGNGRKLNSLRTSCFHLTFAVSPLSPNNSFLE